MKMIATLLAIVLLSAVGSAYITSWVFTSRTAVPKAGDGIVVAAQKSDYNPDLIWDAGNFTVNLLTETAFPNYVKTGISFRINEKKAIDELEKRRVQVRDKVITVLRTTSGDELKSAEGLDTLKQRLTDEVSQLIVGGGGRVLEVYFSELVVQ